MESSDWIKNLRTPLLLSSILAIGGGIVYWHEFIKRPQTEEIAELSKKIFKMKDMGVAEMALIDDRRTVRLRCADLDRGLCKKGDQSSWNLLEPLQTTADKANSNSFLTSLEGLTPSETLDLSADSLEKRQALLKQYGMDPEHLKDGKIRALEIKFADNSIQKVYLGETHPIGDKIFAAVEIDGKLRDDKVYLVPSFTKRHFEQKSGYWRDKKLFSAQSSSIESFDLLNKKNERIEGKKEDGRWLVKKGGSWIPGDQDSIETLLNTVVHLNAQDIISDSKNSPLSKATLKDARPAGKIKIREKDSKESLELELFAKMKAGSKPGKDSSIEFLYGKVSQLDPLYQLEVNVDSKINKGSTDLKMSKLISTVDRYSVDRIKLESKGYRDGSLDFEKHEGKWQSLALKDELDAEKITDLLDHLSGSQIRDFSLKAGKASDEKLVISLGVESNPTKRHIEFWKAGNKLYAKDLASDEKTVFELDQKLNQTLPWKKDYFKKKAEK